MELLWGGAGFLKDSGKRGVKEILRFNFRERTLKHCLKMNKKPVSDKKRLQKDQAALDGHRWAPASSACWEAMGSCLLSEANDLKRPLSIVAKEGGSGEWGLLFFGPRR